MMELFTSTTREMTEGEIRGAGELNYNSHIVHHHHIIIIMIQTDKSKFAL